MLLELTPEQATVLRSIGAKINGALGGSARSAKKVKAVRRNAKKALKARLEAAHAA